MGNVAGTPAEALEYQGRRLLFPYRGNASVKEILTDTSGSWRRVARYGRIEMWRNDPQQ